MKLRAVWLGVILTCAYGLAGCPPTPPTPTPTPTPEPTPTPVVDVRPTSPVYTDLLLRTTAQGTWLRNGQAHQIVGAIPCWPTDGTGEKLIVFGRHIPYWWSLISREWMDETRVVGVNAAHVRLGPGIAAEACCGMEEVGGPYAEATAMQLRRTNPKRRSVATWNPKYWERVHQILHHAGRIGFNVEVDVLDGWQVKHSIWGDTHMPWPAEDVHTGLTYPPNASVREWVKKVVLETDGYANVIYQISNESSLGPGWSPEWERAMYALIRSEEKLVVHTIGSNTRDDGGPYDYYTTHNGSALGEPFAGRPIMMNENNPSQPAATFKARHCVSRPQSYWYWRSDGSDAVQDASLNSLRSGCGGATGCPDPQPLPVSTFACHWNGQWYDCTPQQHSCSQCEAIGMGEFNGGIRCDCPVRNECPDTPGYEGMCDSRATCERVAMGGYPVWRGVGGGVEVNTANENRLQARCDGCSALTICAADGVTGCTKVF